MAGIIVSGGVYSGSGDVTADWFWAKYHTSGTGRVFLPDGTLTLTAERSNLAFAYEWQGSSDYLHHSSGTVKITYAGGTQVNTDGAAPVNATTGRKGQFYDLIIDQGSNPRTTDPVLLVTRESSANYMGIENSLTIISGTARIGDTDVTNTTKIGHVYIGASGTFSAGNVAAVNNGGYNNWDSSGSISVQSVIFNDTNGVFVGNGGTIQVLGPYTGNDSDHYVWDNNSKGTVYHNSGTIQFGGVGLLAIGQTSENATYNNYRNNNRAADGAGQASNGDGGYLYNMSVGFRDGDSPTRHLGLQAVSNVLVSNDLTVLTSGGIDKSTYGSTISGSVTLETSAYWGNYAAQGGTNNWGRLYMGASSYFKAPTGTLTLNKAIGGYTMYNPEGTFVHNNGNVAIEFDNIDATQVRNQSMFYNYEQTLTAAAHRVNWRGNGSAPYDFTIANNATIKEGSFRPTAPTNTIIISGALEVQSGGNYGYSAGDFEASSSIGSIDIKSGGNMYASTDRTTVTTGNFTDDGTFHHNDGEVVMEAAAADLDGTSTTTFYDLTSENFIDVTKSINVENKMKALGSNSWRFVTNQTITMGTATGSGEIEVGTASGKGMRFTNLNKTYKFEAVNELYPWVGISSGASWNNGEPGNTIELKWCDMQFDLDTQGSGGDEPVTWKLTGDSKFKNVTLTNGDTLTVNDYRIETDSLFLDGVFNASSSLIVANDKLKTNSNSTINNSGTSAIVSHSGSSTCRWNRGTWDNIMYRGNGGEVHFDTNNNNPTNLIVAGGTFNTKGMHFNGITSTRIANGGILNNTDALTAGGIYDTTTFSNRGGLFASSSALTFDGTDDKVTIDENYDAIGTSNKFTVEGWFKTAVKVNYMHIFSRGSSWATGNITVYMNSDGYIQASANDLSNTLTVSEDLSDGKWHHFAYTYDQTDVKLYIDGALKASAAKTNTLNNVTTKSDIGTRGSAVNTWWNGEIGRVSIWSSALTALQMKTMMFQDFATATTTNCLSWYQFDAGEGTAIIDSAGTQNGVWNGSWANQGTWTAGGPIGAASDVIAGNLYIGTHSTTPTVFSSSYFPINNRKLVSASKLVSKAHMGTLDYYIATSGTNDFLSYQHLESAPIGSHSDVYILANGLKRSYFEFDSDARNEQCNILVNAGVVRIVSNSDFYTQDFDNAQGEWIRSTAYDGIIHDDGSTPHEYEPIDIMDDQDSFFDTEDLID
jgi:hypothetical protein